MKKLIDAKEVPADKELFATWDYNENSKGWIVAWNEDLDGFDSETGEYLQYAGMRTNVIEVFETRAEAENYVKRFYQREEQLIEHPTTKTV